MTPEVEVKHLKKYFEVHGGLLHAVDDVSFKIEKGTTMGVVGESGCGKSTLGRTIIHLHESTDGQIFLNGEDITTLKKKGLKEVRQKMQIIFQDPYSSINPRMTVEDIIGDPLRSYGWKKSQLKEQVEKLMEYTGVEKRLAMAYPHELDGGRRQRVGIARALALNPEFIVCDEPVSALDVSVQAQVINLLLDLQEQRNLTMMFITHDLSVVRLVADNICVMYLGQLVETASTDALFERRLHPYTKALFSAIPSVDVDNPPQRILIQGELTSPINPKPGCRFYDRCPYAEEQCKEPQHLEEIEPEHFVSCCRVADVN